MAATMVGSKMWQILLFLSSTAFLQFVDAEDLQHGQITGTLKLSPDISALLPNYQPLLYDPAGNLGGKVFEAPIIHNTHANQFERHYSTSDNCPQLESIKKIFILLKRLLNQDDIAYFLQPEKRMDVLQILKEYSEKSDSRNSEAVNGLKLKELIARTDKAVLDNNNASAQSINDKSKKDHVETNVIFKYDIPDINNVGCKEALKALIKTVNDAYLQMIKFCNQLGKCKFSSEQNSFNIQHSDKRKTVLDSTVPTRTKITLTNPSLSSIYDIENFINNNQVLNQNSLSDYSNPRSQSELINNLYLTTNNLNSGTVQSQNDYENKVNINLNKEASQSNIQYGDKSNVLKLNNLQVQLTPANPWNNPGDLTQRLSNVYMKYPSQQQSYLDTNKFISDNALNTGVVQTNSKQTENLDLINMRYLNIFNNNDLKNNINTPKFENDGYNPIPILQTQNVERYAPPNYSNYRNQELYKVFSVVNDNKASVATLNQNNHNTKEQIQFIRGPIANYDFSNLNYPSYIKPNHYQNIGLKSPKFYPPASINPLPYISSINLNSQNSLNYNSQKADATVQSNFGLNLSAPITLRDYLKHDIYGNILFDSNRLVSAPNLDKLNSVADKDGVIELTYKLKQPQSIVSYNPDYYVKFRIPYKAFVSKITGISNNPYIRTNPLKLQKELLAISNFAGTSPDIKNIQHDEVSKLILNNGGTLVNAKIMAASDSNANEYLKTIQNLNGNLDTNEILNVVENGRTSSQTTTLDSGLPSFIPEQNNAGQLSYQTVNEQYSDDKIPRRLLPPQQQSASSPTSLTFLPAKFASQFLTNEKPVTVLANLS